MVSKALEMLAYIVGMLGVIAAFVLESGYFDIDIDPTNAIIAGIFIMIGVFAVSIVFMKAGN